MKNDVRDSAIVLANENAEALMVVRKEIFTLMNYATSLEESIKTNMSLYDIKPNEINSVILEEAMALVPIPLAKLLETFDLEKERTILDLLSVKIEIDYEKTKENLMFSGLFQESIVNAIIKKLVALQESSERRIIVR